MNEPVPLFASADGTLRVMPYGVELGDTTYFLSDIRTVSLERRSSARAAGVGLLLTGIAVEAAVYGFVAMMRIFPFFAPPTILLGIVLILLGALMALLSPRMHRVRLRTSEGEMEILRTRDRASSERLLAALRSVIQRRAPAAAESVRGRVTAVENPAYTPGAASAFISYGSPDSAFARELWKRLVARGIKVFFSEVDAVPGERLHAMMRRGVNEYDRVIVVCSRAGLTRPGVRNEIQETLTREALQGGSSVLIPAILDDFLFAWDDPLAQPLKTRMAVDFREPEDFDEAFERLVRAIAATPDPDRASGRSTAPAST